MPFPIPLMTINMQAWEKYILKGLKS